MTESKRPEKPEIPPGRKPAEVTFRTWVDQQISEAAERGAFDNLPGAGKPLPRRDDDDDGMAWIRDKVRREGLSTEAMLPTPLRLMRESERLAEGVGQLRTEQLVREAAADLNHRITEWRRIPVGPPVFVRLVDEEELVRRWREAQPEPAEVPAEPPAAASPAVSPRWWRRLSRRR
jgi:hypothetical protein